jgi:hypothetical protein
MRFLTVRQALFPGLTLAALALAGCMTNNPHFRNPASQEQAIDSWQGASVAELTAVYGAPQSSHSLESGGAAYTYTHSYTPRPTDSSHLAENWFDMSPQTADIFFRNDDPQTSSCEITFIIEPEGTVVDGNITRRQDNNFLRDICAEMVRGRGDYLPATGGGTSPTLKH